MSTYSYLRSFNCTHTHTYILPITVVNCHCQSLPENNVTLKSLLKFSKVLEVCVETNAYKPKHT